MKLAITSIQRNRNPWIVEWLAFHMLVGFNEFHIYAHKCTDGMDETLKILGEHYPIHTHCIDSDCYSQQLSYHDAWVNFGDKVDWMAFIDGDEFLFPTRHGSMAEALAHFDGQSLSALAAYWMCYGSNGHIADPVGPMVENFPRHSAVEFAENRHVKTIMRGGEKARMLRCHVFETPNGTFDEKMRPVTEGRTEYEPSYEFFRINHYVTQSYDFFKNVKQNMGTADNEVHVFRPDEYFVYFDRNECADGAVDKYLGPLKLKIAELQSLLQHHSSARFAPAQPMK